MQVGSRARTTCQFDWEAQARFANLSADRNPMHMDFVAARRTQAGQPVVHGVHAVLWALESMAERGTLGQLQQIKAGFQKLIYVGDEVELETVRQDQNSARLNIRVDGVLAISIQLAYGEPGAAIFHLLLPETEPEKSWPQDPVVHTLDSLRTATGWLSFAHDNAAAASAFPFLSMAIGAQRVSALACMSRLVGMVCPGMHSTFYRLAMNVVAPDHALDAIGYRVKDVDERFRMIVQEVAGGGWSGTIDSVARLPPVAQLSMQEVAHLVVPDEFKGTQAFIVGGSRGLGELTAKLIACGGGSVTITYVVGREDALNVQAQIRQWGGHCEILAYDATRPAEEQIGQLTGSVTSLYYFATTTIFLRKTKLFSAAVFERFRRIYVDGFYDLCIALEEKIGTPLAVFYPSSIAVEERPAEMTEYAMAKAAGEVLCADLARFGRNFHLVVERLPRMLTDQTITVTPVKSEPPEEVMMQVVRRTEERRRL